MPCSNGCVVILLATILTGLQLTAAATCFGSTSCPNGGTCTSPDFCTCNQGYFSPRCEQCRPIPNCPEVFCSNFYDNKCIRCDGEFGPSFGAAYQKTGDQRRCIKQCSWRTDSNACFPGACTDGHCTCSSGFSGADCRTMDENQTPVLSELRATLIRGATTLEVPGSQDGGATLFTNMANFTDIRINWKSSYQPAGLPNPSAVDGDGVPIYPYISDISLGVVSASVTAVVHMTQGGTYSIGSEACSAAGSEDSPATDLVICDYTFAIDYNVWTPSNGDVLRYDVQSTSGGRMQLYDRDHDSNIVTRYYTGQSATATANFTFDLDGPYHCQNASSGCRTTMLYAGDDVTSEATLIVTWQDWTDDLSGIKEYHMQVRQLSGGHGDEMTEIFSSPAVYDDVTDSGQNVTLPHAGVYSVVLSVFDEAGNARLSRRFVLFDDNPNDVTIQSGSPLRVLSARQETKYLWLTDSGTAGGTIPVTLDWRGHFTNTRHHHQGFLKPIGSYSSSTIERDYDQYFGRRGRVEIPNALGVTEFRVFHDIDHHGGRTIVNASNDNSDYWSNDATNTQSTVGLALVDGDSVRFWVEARDIAGHFVRDSVLVHVDSTPPVIEDGGGGFSVRNSGDLQDTSISFRTYDIHSGLRTIEWRILDNSTNSEVELARQTLAPVKINENIQSCDPADCMCVPIGDCYAMDYGFNPSLHIGDHASNYVIMLTVANHARLITTKTIQVTVDTSPPRAGVVHDGVRGSSEVDFQESSDLAAHWEGFSDRESGIQFYEFLFDCSCWNDATVVGAIKDNMTRTSSTHASWTAPSAGRYYITVVAYNSAQEASLPVCSDGVVIDTSPPEVCRIAIGNARMWPGVAKDAEGRVWFVDERRRKTELVNASSDCISKATLVDDLSIYPEAAAPHNSSVILGGDVHCQRIPGIEEKFFLATDKHMTISWTGWDADSSIFDYEVGLSTDPSNLFPDLVTFMSTSGHNRFVMHHPHISQGSVFYLVVKAVNRAQLSAVKVVGPIVVDTTPPLFVGRVTVRLEGEYLVTEWEGGFIDDEDTSLAYQVGIGHTPGGTETLAYQTEKDLRVGPCLSRSSCAAFSLASLDWYLHGDHEYYASVRAANAAGLTTVGTSLVYRHIVQLPSLGVVLDVAPLGEEPFVMSEVAKDIDVQMDTTSISARWFGFEHPHLEINYEIAVGSEGRNSSDVSGGFIDVGNATFYRLEGLHLKSFTTYFVTVRASSETGSVNITSDGVTVLQEELILNGTSVKDGLGCDQEIMEGLPNRSSAPGQSPCEDDITYQSSTSDISARWTIPGMLQPFVTNVLWAVEQKMQVQSDDKTVDTEWTTFLEYEDLGMAFRHTETNVGLHDGAHYRSKVQFCHNGVCNRPIVTDGFWVLSQPPEVGRVTTSSINSVRGRTEILVIFQPFVHEYVRHDGQAELMDFYEWSIVEGGMSGGGEMLSEWKAIADLVVTRETAEFTASYEGRLDLGVCLRLLVRGYNKVGLSSVASTRFTNCDAATLNRHRIVIDADHEVTLKRYAVWSEPDKKYILSTTTLSAVWPALRHGKYIWAAITDTGSTEWGDLDAGLQSPCDHPMVQACGETDREFVNVGDLSLEHGSRYRICVHADEVTLEHETWNQTLPSVSSCSDGVIVDTTPPMPGSVWIGGDRHQPFQTSTSELVLHWEDFTDAEEHGVAQHHSGIRYYEFAIGSFRGGSDVKEFTRIGITDSVIVNNLILQNGHKYYATIRATDLVGLYSQATSDPVTVDTSPPTVNADQTLKIGGSFIRSLTSVSVSWENVFADKESGLAYYEWAVGSHPGHADIMTFTRVNSEFGISDPTRPLFLHEGHSYFVSVKAINSLQLIILKSFGAFSVETSPPLAGHVFDWLPAIASANPRDLDFQTERTVIGAFWKGFHDPHSAVTGYSWKAGTCKGCGDVVPQQHVGLDTNVIAENLSLVPGLRYYVTVTACNAADLCTEVTSDGVVIDDSPPVPGRVYDGGRGGGDINFQSSRVHVSAHWWGFQDPHSGLSHYEWRVGTTPGAGDVLPSTRLELSEEALMFLPESDQMPVDTDIYITVRAYNRAGMWSEATSNGFRVDPNPPDVVNAPAVDETMGVAVQNTQVVRDLIRFSWKFEDAESGIRDQYLSVGTHRNGDINIAPIRVAGSETDHTFNNLTLDDGSRYIVTVVACNYAGLCTDAKAEPFLVDASAPSAGTFTFGTASAPNVESTGEPSSTTSLDETTPGTTHSTTVVTETGRPAASSHPAWMTWREDAGTLTSSLALAWLGFADVHSGISHYFVSVGRTYGGSELTPQGPVRVTHRNDGATSDEDVIQTGVITLDGIITEPAHPYLYVSIWAVNGVGLPSCRQHYTFEVSPTSPAEGALVLLQSCSAATCEGHCACAPKNRVCTPTLGVCSDVTINNPNSEIEVLDTLDLRFGDIDSEIDVDDTPTQHTMAAVWRVTERKGMDIRWYEWSIGDDSSSAVEPAGVYDPAKERIWFDVGQDNHTAIVLPQGRKLTVGVKYYIFVRAWYDANTHAVFRSDGVTPDVTPPKISKIATYQIKDIANVGSTKDTDYITDSSAFFVSWERVFLDTKMSHYQVSLSTFPGGEDVLRFSDNTFPASNSSARFAGLTLQSGQRYYSNVRASNRAGLHTLRSSDGFVVDTRRPEPGQVYDGIDLHDVEYQNSSTLISASWHGFVDLESYIDHYEWCVGRTPGPGDDGILPCIDVGIHLSASKTLAVPLTEGVRYYSKIVAVDAAGLRSVAASSDGFVVDSSPPEPQEHITQGENLIINPSFESTEGLDTRDGLGVAGDATRRRPMSWDFEPDSRITVVVAEGTIAQDGRSFLSLHGSISQAFDSTRGGHYRVTFFASHAVPSNDPLVNQEGRVEAPGLNRVFRLYDLPAHGHSNRSLRSILWHEHRFYFTADGAISTLKISSVGRSNGILLDNVQVRRLTLRAATGDGAVEVHTQFIHSWSSIQAKWHFTDPESPVVDYSWAVGTVRGGTQLQSLRSVGTQTDAINTGLSMAHGSHVYVTVTARNAAGLTATAASGPVVVDLTAPVIHYVVDGESENDIDFSADDRSFTFRWSASDPESGIDYCQWAVGSEPGSDDVVPISLTPNATSSITAGLSKAPVEGGQRLFATVTCYNRAKLSSRRSSDGVTIVTEPPVSSGAIVRVHAVSETAYGTRGGFRSQTESLRGSWEGFLDPVGIQYYECNLSGPSSFPTSWTPCGSTSETNLDWSGLSLADGATFSLSVRAVNQAGLISQAVSRHFTMETFKPSLGETRLLTATWLGNGTVHLGWDGLFSASSSLVYEVSLGSVAGSSDVLQWVETTETGMRVSPLAPHTDYFLTVTAINAAGLSWTLTSIINNG